MGKLRTIMSAVSSITDAEDKQNTVIDWGPSEWCDCLRGRLRTIWLFVRATGIC